MTDEQALPLEAAKQKNNRHALWCDKHDQWRYYVSCVHMIDAWRNGELTEESVRGDCAVAMERSMCPAMKMRREEEAAGKTIYFKPATEIEGPVMKAVDPKTHHNNASYWRGWNSVSNGSKKAAPRNVPTGGAVRSGAASKPAKKTKSADDGVAAGVTDLASLVNDMAEEERVETPAKTANAAKPSASKSNESMLEMARRIMANRAK